MRKAVRWTYKLLEALSEFLASLELLPGVLKKVDPRAALAGTILAVSMVSFSQTLLTPILGLIGSTFALLKAPPKIRVRTLRTSAIIGSFSLIIMLPKVLLNWSDGIKEALVLPLRAASAMLMLVACISLSGAGVILDGFKEFGMPERLREALTLMIASISRELMQLNIVLIARRSRLFSPHGITGEYGLLSSAASELFIRSPEKAMKLSCVLRARIWRRVRPRRSLRDSVAFLALPLYATIAALIEVTLL